MSAVELDEDVKEFLHWLTCNVDCPNPTLPDCDGNCLGCWLAIYNEGKKEKLRIL